MTLAALQGLHVVVSLSCVARRSTCFFATISETSDEDNNTIWLCPYWATASLLTMLSVAHIFSCQHNQCSGSIDHFPVLYVWPMTLAALQGLHVVVSLSCVARRSTCFFATISETSDEDKNPIWLCPYWATASLLTMLSVAQIFSCQHNQCRRSVDHFPSFCLDNDTCSPAGSSCCCQLVFCSKEEHLFLRYDLWNVRWRQKSNLTLPLLSYSKPVDNVECCAYLFLSAQRLCSGSIDHSPVLYVWPMTLAALQGLHVVVSLSCEQGGALVSSLRSLKRQMKTKIQSDFALTELQQACWQCWVLR